MKKLSTKQLMILLIVVDIVLCGIFVLTMTSKKAEPAKSQISDSNIQRICELATLDCFYHNVSDWSQSAYNFLGYGAKKVWIEYDGIVRVGIQAGNIKISSPDNDDVITVTVPDAVILDNDLDENSIKEIDSEFSVLGIFADPINTEDRKNALINAQKDMVESASRNQMILGEALERAKKIIERNILALSEGSGNDYKVRFVNASEVRTDTSNGES